MRQVIKNYQIHDIPNYPLLYIREGDVVFVTDKHTGEISEHLTLLEYVQRWCKEWELGAFGDYYTKGLLYPKDSPDTAKNIAELRKLCSDKTRDRKGDDGFLLDFLWANQITVSETKLFKYLCDNVVVWNYSVVDQNMFCDVLELKSKKHAQRMFKSLQEKGLIRLVSERFEVEGEWRSLVKLHPKLYWKGRYSAWAHACGQHYEYLDDVELS